MAVSRGQILQGSLITAALPLLLLIVTAVASERIVVEKLLTTLFMPLCLLWLLLWAAVAFSWVLHQKRIALTMLALWSVFTIGTSPLTAYLLAAGLESNVEDVDVHLIPSLDAVIVLGGGTTESPQGRAVVGGAGERVVLGARLFHAGKTKLLVTTGETIETLRRSTDGRVDRDGAEETKEIWMALGVPEEKIQILGGRNTREEMRVLKDWLAVLPADAQVGLITSAWHLPRAMRLAEQENLKFVPLPADFIAGRPPSNLIELLPSGGAAGKLEMVLKEYLARLVGR